VTTRVLSVHARYACRHSGACCSSGWRIPVDDEQRRALERAASAGSLPGTAARTESRDGLTVLRLAGDGTCTAFEHADSDRLAMCAIHRVLGPEALPVACRHFPRVCLLDPRGVSITLSHFCPTAAALLFEDRPLAVIEDPPGFVGAFAYEGLDAREALPPLLAPGMLMDLESYAMWEARALGVLADDRYTPESALAALGVEVERLRTWSPRQGPLLAALSELPGSDPSGSDPVGSDPIECRTRRFRDVLDCLHEWLEHPQLPEDPADLDERWVTPRWTEHARPLRRYLAARLHASWVAYQGRGLRTVVESLAAALAVVRVEAARACAETGRPVDKNLLIQAIRAADLLLVHKADSLALARRWSDAERAASR
jgi:Fe-S-cluster containining protein